MKIILTPSAAIGAIALALLTAPRAANATSYTITVDASTQTAGNPPFWAAAVGTGTAALTLRSDQQYGTEPGVQDITIAQTALQEDVDAIGLDPERRAPDAVPPHHRRAYGRAASTTSRSGPAGSSRMPTWRR